jgi:hypothetical protein
MEILYALGLLIAVTVVPIMVGARVVGAKNTGFGSALIAVVVLAALSFGVAKFIQNPILAFVVSAAGGGVFLSAILGTSFWRGIAVSVIAVAVQIAVLVMFAGAIIGGGAISG